MSWYKQLPRCFIAAIFVFHKVIGVFPFKLVTNQHGKILACASKYTRSLSVTSSMVLFISLPFIILNRLSMYEETYDDHLVTMTVRLEIIFLYIKYLSFYFIVIFKYRAYMKIVNELLTFYDLIHNYDKTACNFNIVFSKIFIFDTLSMCLSIYFDRYFYFSNIGCIKILEDIVDIYSNIILLNVDNIFVTFLLSSALIFKEVNNQLS